MFLRKVGVFHFSVGMMSTVPWHPHFRSSLLVTVPLHPHFAASLLIQAELDDRVASQTSANSMTCSNSGIPCGIG